MAKILIVDDEPRIRELIRENLQYSGYTCEVHQEDLFL